jgi:hypothetical protein
MIKPRRPQNLKPRPALTFESLPVMPIMHSKGFTISPIFKPVLIT